MNQALAALFAAFVLGGLLLLLLVVTADRWLVALLTGLDRILTRLGFGTWSAGLLTRLEVWARARREDRARRKAGGGEPEPPK